MDKRKINQKIAIVTTTLYELENLNFRKGFAEKTIKESINEGFKIIIADGNSSDSIKQEFKDLGAEIIRQEKGLGNGRRQVIRKAYEEGYEAIAWIEPEKYSLVQEIRKTAMPILKGEADLVIPQRKSLLSYPDFQQHAENFGNCFWRTLTGVPSIFCLILAMTPFSPVSSAIRASNSSWHCSRIREKNL